MTDDNPYRPTGGVPIVSLPFDEARIEIVYLRTLAWDRAVVRLTALPYAILGGEAALAVGALWLLEERRPPELIPLEPLIYPAAYISPICALLALLISCFLFDSGERAIDRSNPTFWRIKLGLLFVPLLNLFIARQIVRDATKTLERRSVKVGFLRCDLSRAHAWAILAGKGET